MIRMVTVGFILVLLIQRVCGWAVLGVSSVSSGSSLPIDIKLGNYVSEPLIHIFSRHLHLLNV